eukprot:220516-Chlamydomonas_euryale.AAC.2
MSQMRSLTSLPSYVIPLSGHARQVVDWEGEEGSSHAFNRFAKGAFKSDLGGKLGAVLRRRERLLEDREEAAWNCGRRAWMWRA